MAIKKVTINQGFKETPLDVVFGVVVVLVVTIVSGVVFESVVVVDVFGVGPMIGPLFLVVVVVVEVTVSKFFGKSPQGL